MLEVFHPYTASQIKDSGEGPITPLSLGEANRELKQRGAPLPSDVLGLHEFAQQLARGGLLVPAGAGKGSPPMSACYYSIYSRTAHEKKGLVWLTKALGWEFLALEVEALVAMVVGVTANGDKSSGSGLLLGPRHVLTNQHVVRDMEVEGVWADGSLFTIATCKSHPDIDVGLIETKTDMRWREVGLSFRTPRLVEPILCLGHPPVPKAAVEPKIIAQSGEVVGFVPRDHEGQSYALFSVIARPGNSGGPIFGADGRVIGIVSRSLEEKVATKKKKAPTEKPRDDRSHPLPFFAAVPSEEVKRALEDLGSGARLPWETYE